MPSKKIVPELTIDERIANATKARDQARDELIRLIQQKPSSNLFVRTFVRIRNFFHSLLPTWNMFKSPIKVAFEKLIRMDDELSRLPISILQVKNKNGTLFSWYHSSSSTKGSSKIQSPADSKTVVNDVFKRLVADKIKPTDAVSQPLLDYLNFVVKRLNATPDPLITACPQSWCDVRGALVDTEITPELEDILFKLKVLYPCTTQYDELYDEELKKETACGSTGSMFKGAFESTTFLGNGNTPVLSQTKSGFDLFRSMLGCKQLPPDEMKRLKTQKDLEVIQERINDLSTTCGTISKINNLQSELKNLLNASIQGDQVRVKQSNKTITGWMNDLQVKLTHRNVSTNDTEIKNAKEILATLQKDINTLDQEYLKSICTVNSDEDSTLRL